MAAKHVWNFKSRLRSYAFGWKGSHLPRQRLKAAVTEIKQVARTDPVIAGDGVVSPNVAGYNSHKNARTESATR